MFTEAIPSLAAVFYDKVPARALGNFYRDVATDVVGLLHSGRLLDVGSGPGYLPLEIARGAPALEVVGIDLSPKMVEIARGNGAGESLPNLSFEVADANHLPYEDSCFDLVISTGALHHWHHMRAVFLEINRVLKVGGAAWVYDLRRDASGSEIRETLGKRGAYMRLAFKFHGLKTGKYHGDVRKLLQEIGVAALEIEKRNAFMKISWEKA